MPKLISVIIILLFCTNRPVSGNDEIVPGAEQHSAYLPLLKNKKVALVVNHSSIAGKNHIVDFLISKKVKVKKIFAPEHGFRGDASAGEVIKDGVDVKTKIPVVSLYGKTRKPTPDHLKNIDIVVFDIQDVGCRFYTYISTLHMVIEACAENNIPLLVLDRPNPNGDYVAGPVLKPGFESFVGIDPIPVVHGCTVGELAQMIVGEKWTVVENKCDLKVIPVLNYTHKSKYDPPVPPSPNLPNYLSVRLYPSICFFEATSVSLGRGTDFPFQVLGGLDSSLGSFQFIPQNKPGVAVDPLNENQVCYGVDLRELKEVPKFTLRFILDFYWKYKYESDFIIREKWFDTLAGTDVLLSKIRGGNNEEEIMEVFEPDIVAYKAVRKKYLLYPDFE